MFERLAPPAAGPIAVFQPGAVSSSAGDVLAAAAKSTPPIAVSVTAAAGIPLEHWVMLLTAAYLLLQIGYLLYKWRRDLRRERAGQVPVLDDE